MADIFLYGTLRHLPLLRVVLGRDPGTPVAARLPDHAVVWARGQAFPLILRRTGDMAEGLLLQDLSEAEVARLDFYEGGFGYGLEAVEVETGQGRHKAMVYFPSGAGPEPGEPWSLEAWEAQWAEISVAAAREAMARIGRYSARDVAGMLPFFRARAWGHMLARDPAPQVLRNPKTIADVDYRLKPDDAYEGFFQLRPFSLRYRKFDGGWSARLDRECFVAWDVALVLPYDPVADTVLLIEQLRFGPIHRGDPAPWVLEAVAGVVDAGETPEEAARRETLEEAGVAPSQLLRAPTGYASPGYSTEFYHCFIGLSDLGTGGTGAGGLDEENEDIRTHVVPFSRAMELVTSGEINAMPLAMLLCWLATQRDALRAAA